MEYFERVKLTSFKHKLGNFISGFTKILDGIVAVISLGNINSNITIIFLIFRVKNKFLLEKQDGRNSKN